MLLVLVALIPAVLLVAGTGVRQRQRATEDVKMEAIRLARQVAGEQTNLVEQTGQLLVALAQIPAVREAEPDACGQLLAQIKEQYPFTANLGVITLDGHLSCSALPFEPPVDLSDRSYFQRALASQDLAIGDYQVGRVTGVPSVNLGYPVKGERDEPVAVVAAALHLSWLNNVVSDAGLPEEATVILFDGRGTILVRYPDPQDWVGSGGPDTDLFDQILAVDGEGAFEALGVDGVRRLYGVTRLGAYGGDQVYVAVGLPSASAFEIVDRALFTNLIGLGLITILALSIALVGGERLVGRPLAELGRAAGSLGQGDLAARTGLPHDGSELGQLAMAFDRMAESLESNAGRQREFEEALRSSEELYRLLFTEMHSAFVLHEMIYDEQGQPYDYRFLQVNPAFERLTGLSAELIEGRTAREISSAFNEEWLRRYARVVETGESLRYEDYVEHLDKHLEVSAYRPREGRFAAMSTDITDRVQAQATVQRQLERLRALRAIDLAIASSFDPRVTFDVLLEQVISRLEVDAACLLLYSRNSRRLTFQAGRGFRSDALRHTNLRLGEGHAGRAALEREMVRVADLEQEAHTLNRSPLMELEQFISYVAVPLEAKGQIKGVLEVFHRQRIEPDQDWLDFLEALAGQAAIAIDNAALFNDLRISNQDLMLAYDTTLEGWAKALELRDDETEGHSARVTDLTVRLGRQMGVSDEELVHIRRGALLHDIGKIGIPDDILLKPGPLTDDEWEIMHRHPELAYDLLISIGYLRQAMDIPYSHHERWDGSGYPRGLAGERIPLAARIFAVVDVWDALCSDRPYRAAWDEADVIVYLREQAGVLFDPSVVEFFLEMEKVTAEASQG